MVHRMAKDERRVLGEPSVFDRLDLDPALDLSELADELRELASSADPAQREAAREAFERLTLRPELHFEELLATVPREPIAAPIQPQREVPHVLTTKDVVLPPKLVDRLGPPTEAERRVWLPCIEAIRPEESS